MPTLRDGTEPIIAHGSVYLRPAERSDIPLFVTLVQRLRRCRATSRIRAPMSIPAEEQWFERAVANQGKDGYHFDAACIADDRPIGTSACSSSTSSTATPAWGSRSAPPPTAARATAPDMLRALLAFGFDSLRLERIELDVYDFNTDAHRLYQRLGFVDEGVARHRIFREGRHVDLFQMSMLAAEYRARYARLAADVPLGERLEQPVDGVEERLRDLLRQRVPDGVLRPVGGPSAHRRLAQVGEIVVAEPVGQRLEVGDPSVGAAVARRGHQPVSGPRGDHRGVVDRGVLVARRDPRTARSRAAARLAGSRRRHRSESEALATLESAGRTRTSARRLRSEPLTRMRNE